MNKIIDFAIPGRSSAMKMGLFGGGPEGTPYMQLSPNAALQILSGWNTIMSLGVNGYGVGVGTPSPAGTLHSIPLNPSLNGLIASGTSGQIAPVFTIGGDDDGIAWTTFKKNRLRIYNLNSGFYGEYAANKEWLQIEPVSSNYVFSSNTTGTGVARNFAFLGANVGIGTTNPGNYKLAVNGTAIFTKVQVKAAASDLAWPDYVFEPNYELRTLSSLKEYINENKHLPDLPSAEEVQKEGVDLASGQATLLKKIEELTLYVIEQGKKNDKLENQNKLLWERLEKLEGKGIK